MTAWFFPGNPFVPQDHFPAHTAREDWTTRKRTGPLRDGMGRPGPPKRFFHLPNKEGTMDPWIDGVRRVLARTPSGALSFSELLGELCHEGLGAVPDSGRLLAAVSGRRDLFRVLRLSRGPWSRPGFAEALRAGGESPPAENPWIILLPTPDVGIGPGEPILHRIRIGLVEWGRSVDEHSPASVARWLRASREGTRASAAVASGQLRAG